MVLGKFSAPFKNDYVHKETMGIANGLIELFKCIGQIMVSSIFLKIAARSSSSLKYIFFGSGIV